MRSDRSEQDANRREFVLAGQLLGSTWEIDGSTVEVVEARQDYFAMHQERVYYPDIRLDNGRRRRVATFTDLVDEGDVKPHDEAAMTIAEAIKRGRGGNNALDMDLHSPLLKGHPYPVLVVCLNTVADNIMAADAGDIDTLVQNATQNIEGPADEDEFRACIKDILHLPEDV